MNIKTDSTQATITIDELATEMRGGFRDMKATTDALTLEMRAGFRSVKATTDALTTEMREGFADVHEKIDTKIDTAFNELAGMVAREFKVVHGEIADLQADMEEVKDDVDHLDHRMDIFQKSTGKDHDIRIRRVERKLQIA